MTAGPHTSEAIQRDPFECDKPLLQQCLRNNGNVHGSRAFDIYFRAGASARFGGRSRDWPPIVAKRRLVAPNDLLWRMISRAPLEGDDQGTPRLGVCSTITTAQLREASTEFLDTPGATLSHCARGATAACCRYAYAK